MKTVTFKEKQANGARKGLELPLPLGSPRSVGGSLRREFLTETRPFPPGGRAEVVRASQLLLSPSWLWALHY